MNNNEQKQKDFTNGKVYCIRNYIDKEIYVGSTCQPLKKRMWHHKSDATRNTEQTKKLYIKMNLIGYEQFYIELLEECPCHNLMQLRKREGELMRELNASLNSVLAGRTKEEYRQEHKEYLKQKIKEWNIRNKEHRQQYEKDYRDKHKEKKQEYDKNYNKIHNERITEQKRLNYIKNRDDINKKITCDCGAVFCKSGLSRHQRRKKHQAYLNSLINQ